ncbi:MAG TPA: FecR domain-containing protein [Verrucomicrobiae bacterium]|nr:FecR domain-containing protein [Verrucomicrobiae bacterium]
MTEIRNQEPDPAVVEAAAARVWARLSQASAAASPAEHIRGCADFQALIPDFRAGRLPEARALLVQDHLHNCVACRHVYEGKVVTMPSPSAASAPAPARSRRFVLWAAAAAAAAAVTVYVYTNSAGAPSGPAVVQALNGRLYLVTEAGFQPLQQGQQFPDGAEIRTAQDSDAVLRLHDGSQVELRERSGFSTNQSGRDLTVRLVRGSVIVEAAKRSAGHLYVDTADCRVAVTGTIFGVSAGAKGSRVSVIQGQVHVTQGSNDKLLKPGDQAVTADDLAPEPVREDIAWSRNRDRYYALLGLRAALETIKLPDLRYGSKLINRLPADTVLFASIPNLADYLSRVQSVFDQKTAESPELRQWFTEHAGVRQVLEKLRDGSAYLGDEIVVVAGAGHGPALFAEARRDGFAQFLAAQGLNVPLESRNGFVVFGPDRAAVAELAPAMDNASGGFAGTPFFARISQAYAEGAGLLFCADLSRMSHSGTPTGMRYIVAEQKEINHQMEARASIGFAGVRGGPAAWLGDPGPMGSLDYVSPDASAMGAFVLRHPAEIIDQLAGGDKTATVPPGSGALSPEVRQDLEQSLGGEVAVAVDGPLVPVPSWKLMIEVYNPARVQAEIEHIVAAYNQHPAAAVRDITVSRETGSGGTVFYTLAATPKNPLTQATYTFSGGYLIAAPSRALVEHALQLKQSGTSILRSSNFLSLVPRDHFANFSALIYHNMGSTLAPLAGLFGGRGGPLSNMSLNNLKPMLVAVYAEPDAITVASAADMLSAGLGQFLTGNPQDWAANLLPFGQPAGTREHHQAYR